MEKNELKIKEKFDESKEFRFLIEETYDQFLGLEKIIFNVSDRLVDNRIFFRSIQDIDFNNEKYGNLLFFVGMLFKDVPGLILIVIEKYKISLFKSPVFYWNELEEKIMVILKNIIIKEREIHFLGRNKVSLFFDSYNNIIYLKESM